MNYTEQQRDDVLGDIKSGIPLTRIPSRRGVSLYAVRIIRSGRRSIFYGGKEPKKKETRRALISCDKYRCPLCGGLFKAKVEEDDRLCPCCVGRIF